uniref:Shugoshin_C domain-containing protein n=1 Tax=Rhabditophanes sp. KR3021 TaxID=114890 RepID=A0AC35UAI4_9BILA
MLDKLTHMSRSDNVVAPSNKELLKSIHEKDKSKMAVKVKLNSTTQLNVPSSTFDESSCAFFDQDTSSYVFPITPLKASPKKVVLLVEDTPEQKMAESRIQTDTTRRGLKRKLFATEDPESSLNSNPFSSMNGDDLEGVSSILISPTKVTTEPLLLIPNSTVRKSPRNHPPPIFHTPEGKRKRSKLEPTTILETPVNKVRKRRISKTDIKFAEFARNEILGDKVNSRKR